MSKLLTAYNRLSRDKNHLRDKRCDDFSYKNQRDERRRGAYPDFSCDGFNQRCLSALISMNLWRKHVSLGFFLKLSSFAFLRVHSRLNWFAVV